MVRVSLSLVVLAMVRSPARRTEAQEAGGGLEGVCGEVAGGAGSSAPQPGEDGELEWDNLTVGLVLSSFGWGYMTTQVEREGSRTVCD